MKKKFYFFLIAMMFSMVASAQYYEYQLGLKGGVGMDFIGINNDNVESTSNGFCYKFGLTGIRYFAESYGISTGFTIIGSDMSYKLKIRDENNAEKTVDRNLHNTYVQVPLMLKMRTDKFGSCRIFGEIGYGFNIFVSENDKYDFHHNYRDVCSSFLLHLGLDVEVLHRSTLQFMLGYDNFFSSLMTMKSDKITMSNLCFEIGFLF